LLKKNLKKLKKREGEKLFREGVIQICEGVLKNREGNFFEVWVEGRWKESCHPLYVVYQ